MPNHAKERQEVAHLVAVIRRPIALLDIDVEMVVAVPGRKLEVLDPRTLKAGRDAAFVRHRAEAIHAERIDLGDLRIGNVDARRRLPPVRPEAPRIVPHGVRVARGENLRPAHAARGRNETRTAARQEVKFTRRVAIRQSLREAARKAVRYFPDTSADDSRIPSAAPDTEASSRAAEQSHRRRRPAPSAETRPANESQRRPCGNSSPVRQPTPARPFPA